MNFVRVNCAEQFYGKLKGIVHPEEKRMIISEGFLVYWDEIKKLADGDAIFCARHNLS